MKPWPDEVDEMLATAKAMADRLDRIVTALDAMGAEAEMVGWSAFDPCDCGHRRNAHRSSRHGNGVTTCLIDDCPCDGFDDTHLRLDAHLARQRERARVAREDEVAQKRSERDSAA